MTVERICQREVDTARTDETAQAAAQRMNVRGVGTLVVVDRDQRPLGILTDRDLALRVVARGLDPYAVCVIDVMTVGTASVREDSPIEEAVSVMRRQGCRRLVVIDEDGLLLGIVSLDDVLELISAELGEVGKLLHSTSTQPELAR